MKKRVVSIIFAIFLVSLSVLPVFAESEGASTYGRLVDNAKLLSEDEYSQLKEHIDTVSENIHLMLLLLPKSLLVTKHLQNMLMISLTIKVMVREIITMVFFSC